MSSMPFDELNRLSAELRETFATNMQKEERKEIIDEVLDILILSYVFGTDDANEMLETEEPVIERELDDSVSKTVAGRTWVERINDYIDNGTADDIIRVAETDSHRIYNEAIYNVGEKVNEQVKLAQSTTSSLVPTTSTIYKTWECMMLPSSRDQHIWLDGTKIPFDQKFYTYTGASAYRPGEFGEAENDVNCLCRLRLSRQ